MRGIQFVLSGIAFLFFTVSSVNAAVTLNIQGGQLMGASGVMVNGVAYDVQFIDDSAMNLFFDGTNWNFTFTDADSAEAASQALLDTVLIDTAFGLFDSNPLLTNGINEHPSIPNPSGQIETLYTYIDEDPVLDPEDPGAPPYDPEPILQGMTAMNYGAGDRDDYVSWSGMGEEAWGVHSAWWPFLTYAVWSESASPVPVPGASLLLASGLIGLAGFTRRKNG